MPYFKGTAYVENYQKDVKHFTFADWVVTVFFGVLIIATIVMGILQYWGIMIMLLGTDIIMIDVMVRTLMGTKSRLLPYFDAAAVFVIIAGLILVTGHGEWMVLYGFCMAALVWLFVGVICLKLGLRKKKKIGEFTQIVTAECEPVDVRKTNLFAFDDIRESYFAPTNENTIFKPGFHYFVNGTEYFSESTVYYGNGNVGYIEGEKVELRVNPKNPAEILPKNENAFMEMAMGISGIIAAVIWIVVIIVMLKLGVFAKFM